LDYDTNLVAQRDVRAWPDYSAEVPQPAPVAGPSDDPDGTRAVRDFLEEAGVLTVDDPIMTRSEMLFFVRGRMR